MAVLATVEASTTATAATTTARLSGLLGLGTVATHVTILATVEASATSAATTATTRLSGLPWFCAVPAHMAVLTTVEAPATTAATATAAAFGAATLLAPPDSDGPATNVVPVELGDSLLSICLIVKVDEGEGTL